MGFCRTLAVLAVACLAASPALGKATDRDKFEKKVSRVARLMQEFFLTVSCVIACGDGAERMRIVRPV